jgi:phosphatidylglycerophosphatase A
MPRAATAIASVGGIGYAPFASGTVASAVAALLALPLLYLGGSAALVAASILAFVIGIAACDAHVRATGRDDPSECVIDEVAGQWLACAFALPGFGGLVPQPQDAAVTLCLAFLLFRLFDIWKPWPVSWAERSFSGGLGVMADDMVAGLLAGLCLMAVRWLVPL